MSTYNIDHTHLGFFQHQHRHSLEPRTARRSHLCRPGRHLLLLAHAPTSRSSSGVLALTFPAASKVLSQVLTYSWRLWVRPSAPDPGPLVRISLGYRSRCASSWLAVPYCEVAHGHGVPLSALMMIHVSQDTSRKDSFLVNHHQHGMKTWDAQKLTA